MLRHFAFWWMISSANRNFSFLNRNNRELKESKLLSWPLATNPAMSYRDLRNFTEMMRALGYPRLISMENFRNPNFALVAEILQWLVLRYDPNSDIPMDVELENDRVLFIKSVAQFMMTKAHIKLNTKRLYAADGMAVKELLKVTSVLYNAAMKLNKQDEEEQQPIYNPVKFDFSSKLSDLKMARQLASEITVKGASLHELLGREVELRAVRRSSIARPLDLSEIEKSISNMTAVTQDEMEKARNQLENIASDEANLTSKIEKRRNELERNQKRLKSLESVRPAFMDEYEQMETELQTMYKVYIEKYRNLAYLENLNAELNKTEEINRDEAENPLKMAERAREEHESMIRGNLNLEYSESENEADMSIEDDPESRKPKVVGSMGGGLDSEDSDGFSSNSEVDDEIIDGDEEEDPLNDSDDNF